MNNLFDQLDDYYPEGEPLTTQPNELDLNEVLNEIQNS